jgi:endonuclease/exonuclease/phosphatase family metal-dependent hydrolase
MFALTESAGFDDTWVAAGDHPPTFWGRRREGAPRRCIDYVLVRQGSTVSAPIAGFGPDSDWAALRRLSDHAPVTVTVSVP